MSDLLIRTLMTILLLEGCADEGAPSFVTSVDDPAQTVTGPQVNVSDFGATGDDESDDSAAFEAAIGALPSTGGTVVVPAGVYLLSAIRTSPNRPIDLSGKHHITITGDGMEVTQLLMAPGSYQAATHMIFVENASDITLEKLTLDGNRAHVVYRDEQSHGVQIVSSTDVRLQQVTFQNMGGDGVRLFGAPAGDQPWTERIRIEDCRFRDLTRNGISLQRAARFVEIRGNTFERISDQSISSEPSGMGAPTDVVIENNVIRHSSAAWAVALAGVRSRDPLLRLEFRNNRVENGAVYVLWADSISVDNNVILGDKHSPLRLEDISKAIVAENEIVGAGQEGPGIIQLVNSNNFFPSDVTVSRNLIHVGRDLTGIYVRDPLAAIAITGNTIIGNNSNKGIQFDNILVHNAARKDVMVTDNIVSEFATALVFTTRGDPFSNVEIRGNSFSHDQNPPTQTVGILFQGTGPWESFATLTANVFGIGIVTNLALRNQ